ncbi:ArpU family phage packaging/lysis transcriptional regulator [Bacillus cereus]|uniref:ArpU family phage packaging/lysis transcriptional regulator n=1 Tax=Bacillus TaxID=1386 RepID=UPI0015C1A25F|nr:ArpU family phage packaging/lysis transcriptional regulator [Bacillus cereus]MDG1630072.1 ArpU family phage packaging/lysis transcriptional regulator [Bacillus cereus]MDG1630135.1 ArpU family phage packaging/lysis transcriptional regulator [Bacillus cereus]MDK7407413.1 ArpU family transcriptional regulator [Bacillus cereus]MDK7413056.1 ArpU family transcriptional regulator [Bacillus cereus]QLF02904.1 ArpU family transcriptional regulator [Bacillus cereus]
MLDIALPVLNKEQTKKNVLQALKKYHLFLSSIDERDIERVQDGKVIGMSKTVLERINYIQEIRKGVEKLDAWEKQLIELAYLGKEKPSWVKMCRILNMSQPNYYRKRNRALCELAYKLGIEVADDLYGN